MVARSSAVKRTGLRPPFAPEDAHGESRRRPAEQQDCQHGQREDGRAEDGRPADHDAGHDQDEYGSGNHQTFYLCSPPGAGDGTAAEEFSAAVFWRSAIHSPLDVLRTQAIRVPDSSWIPPPSSTVSVRSPPSDPVTIACTRSRSNDSTRWSFSVDVIVASARSISTSDAICQFHNRSLVLLNAVSG